MSEKNATPAFSLEAVFNDVTKRKALEGYIQELEIFHGQLKLKKEEISDIRRNAKETLGIPPKVLNKLVKDRMKPGTIESEAKEIEEIKDISDALQCKAD